MTPKVRQGRPMTNYFQPLMDHSQASDLQWQLKSRKLQLKWLWHVGGLMQVFPTKQQSQRSFNQMANAITFVGPGYKVPTCDALKGEL